MSLIFHLLKIFSNTMVLYNSETLNKFTNYCKPKYKFIDSSDKLKKVISIFRHGDRTPLEFDENWKNKSCMVCDKKNCQAQKCESQNLTIKGFEQGYDLGSFIKTYYFPKFDQDVTINSFHSGINRSLSFLKAVLKEINKENSSFNKDIEIIEDKNLIDLSCSLLQNYLENKSLNIKADDIDDHFTLDSLYTGICNNLKVDCTKFNCDFIEIEKFISKKLLIYEDKNAESRENISINAMNFSYYAKMILNLLNDEKSINLVSSHDIVLRKILNGLNIALKEIPPYGSAIFIEVWEDNNNKEYIRLIYNGKIQKIGLYNESKIDKIEFIKYLKLYSSKYKKIKKNCILAFNDKTQDLEKYKNYIDQIFSPVSKFLNKESNFFLIKNNNKKFSLKNLLISKENLKSRFFGFFEGKKSKAKEEKKEKKDESDDESDESEKSKKKLKKDECGNKVYKTDECGNKVYKTDECGSSSCSCNKCQEDTCGCKTKKTAFKNGNECNADVENPCATKTLTKCQKEKIVKDLMKFDEQKCEEKKPSICEDCFSKALTIEKGKPPCVIPVNPNPSMKIKKRCEIDTGTGIKVNNSGNYSQIYYN